MIRQRGDIPPRGKKNIGGRKANQSAHETLLVANGCSGNWSIDLDESLDGDKWYLDIDSPLIYLTFPIQDLKIIPAALRFLESNPVEPKASKEFALTLGRFGTASVSLLRDDEGFPRFFLVNIQPRTRGTFRLTLQDEDLDSFREALRQVVTELPD